MNRRVSLLVLTLTGCGAASPVAEAPEGTEATVETAETAETSGETAETSAEGPRTEVEAEAAPSHLRWELIAEPTPLSMRHLDRFLLRVVATNEGAATESPLSHALSFTVNGESSMIADMAFMNGVSPMTWSALPPGESEQTERALGDLFSAPGTYEISVTVEGVSHSVTVTVVR